MNKEKKYIRENSNANEQTLIISPTSMTTTPVTAAAAVTTISEQLSPRNSFLSNANKAAAAAKITAVKLKRAAHSEQNFDCYLIQQTRNLLLKEKQTLKPLLHYLIRMGSFQLTHMHLPANESTASEDFLNLDQVNNLNELRSYCKHKLQTINDTDRQRPFISLQSLSSSSSPPPPTTTSSSSSSPTASTLNNNSNIIDLNEIKIFQWNILSQALAVSSDKFVTCPEEQLNWSTRKWKLINELIKYLPLDVICLQEVDNYKFLKKILSKINYDGHFTPKPDSPCCYVAGNFGPDGCVIFYNTKRLRLVKQKSRVLEVLHCPSNQVITANEFEVRSTGKHFVVATTHLKAKKSSLLSTMRDQQGKYIIEFLEEFNEQNFPLILTGDFNAEPSEPVYARLRKKFSSAYFTALGAEPEFTTWTQRMNEDITVRTLDYIFFTENALKLTSVMDIDRSYFTGPIPNADFTSDHISIGATFNLN